MIIDREKVKNAFAHYAGQYDLSDVKVKLKADHTYRVAAMCDAISDSLGLDQEDRDIAWLCGMLHDIGRFEQLRRYHTFQDGRSCNHAALSADILFNEGKIRDYINIDGEDGRIEKDSSDSELLSHDHADNSEERLIEKDTSEEHLIEKAIRLHNVYQLPQMTDREYLFATILRDADKIDILRVNCETPITEIYDLPIEAFRDSAISPEVMEDVRAHRNVLRTHSKTGVDFILGHISFVFGLVYQESFRQVKAQGYLAQLLAFQSDNPQTVKDLEEVRRIVDDYMEERLR